MIAIRPPRSEAEARAREGYRQKFPEGAPAAAPPANGRPALLMLGADTFQVPYRGRLYELGHVSFEDGIRLIEARTGIDGLKDGEETAERVAAYLRGMRYVVGLAPRYMVPVKRVRRLFWRLRLRRNPFRKATDAEVGHLLGFFLASRMRSRVPYRAPAASRGAVPTS